METVVQIALSIYTERKIILLQLPETNLQAAINAATDCAKYYRALDE